MLYILDPEGEPIKCNDAKLWGEWMQLTQLRKIGHTTLQKKPEMFVSTVFLGCDHNFRPDWPPILWETMAFNDGHSLDEFSRRYATREQALIGHGEVCERIYKEILHADASQT